MSAEGFTLLDFLSVADMPGTRLAELESHGPMVTLKAALTNRFEGLNWPAVWAAVTGHLGELLDVSLGDVMVRAWNTYRKLHRYSDASRYPPHETYLVPLGEHTIKSSHEPAIEIEVDGFSMPAISFEVEITLKLTGVILNVRGGRIRKIHTGRCKGSGVLKCLGLLLLEKESNEITLPGTFDLGEGIPLGGGSDDDEQVTR